jgi:hypothetical protein
MLTMSGFEIKDCVLLSLMSGMPPAFNLRELRDRIAACSQDVLYHHFCETTLVASFDYPDYRNDFAVWASKRLGDKVLAERLGIIDPYSHSSLEDLRGEVLDIIDERLSELTMVPWARLGHEFYFMKATTIIFDTGERIHQPEELLPAIRRMSNGSIYFHFLEARRRPPVGTDDFAAWLVAFGPEWQPYIEALSGLDFYFSTLSQIKGQLIELFENQNLP